MLKRVTLDTNEYVSAFHFGGRAKHLLHMAVDGEIEIAVSRPIITEILRVLREKFHWEGYDILDAGQRIERIARMVEPAETLNVIECDEPDNRIACRRPLPERSLAPKLKHDRQQEKCVRTGAGRFGLRPEGRRRKKQNCRSNPGIVLKTFDIDPRKPGE